MNDTGARTSSVYAPPSRVRALLTPRQEEVARLMVCRMTYGEIGSRLGCSARTIKAHVQAIAEKIGPDGLPAKARVQAWAFWRYR